MGFRVGVCGLLNTCRANSAVQTTYYSMYSREMCLLISIFQEAGYRVLLAHSHTLDAYTEESCFEVNMQHDTG